LTPGRLQRIRDLAERQINRCCALWVTGCETCRSFAEISITASEVLADVGDDTPPRAPDPEISELLDACDCSDPLCAGVVAGELCLSR
jgi:hypothetical protein